MIIEPLSKACSSLEAQSLVLLTLTYVREYPSSTTVDTGDDDVLPRLLTVNACLYLVQRQVSTS
jgi:hypothetical protein